MKPRRYQILEVLGKGGFGTVYRAWLQGPDGPDRDVALKVLNRDVQANADLASRLRDEARVLGLLRHRAIVKTDGLVLLDDRWTVVMEYVDGLDLHKLMERTTVPPGAVYEIVAEVASALHVAHRAPNADGEPLGLLHRDIKPSNVLVSTSGGVKIVDFGGARGNFANREAKTADTTYGSPGYVAPERLDLEEGPAGDVFSLGVVFLELLCRGPLDGTDLTPSRHQRRIDEAVARARSHSVPEEALDLARQMVAWSPQDRPTARDVENTLRALRSDSTEGWLGDWAAQAIPSAKVPKGELQHDFSSDVLLEDGDHLGGGQPTPWGGSTITTFYDSRPLPDPTARTVIRQPEPPMPKGGVRWTAAAVSVVVFGAGLLALAIGARLLGIGQ